MRFLLDRGLEPIYALLFTSLAALGVLNHLLVRPHVLTWPILVIWSGQLIQSAEDHRPPPRWLLALMVVWTNLHGSYVLGLGLLIFFAMDAIWQSTAARQGETAKAWGIFTGLAFLAVLINPYGWHSLNFIYQFLDQTGLKYISEWRPVDFSSLNALELWILTLIGLMASGLLRLPPARLLIMLILLHEALAHARYISIFSLLLSLIHI